MRSRGSGVRTQPVIRVGAGESVGLRGVAEQQMYAEGHNDQCDDTVATKGQRKFVENSIIITPLRYVCET